MKLQKMILGIATAGVAAIAVGCASSPPTEPSDVTTTSIAETAEPSSVAAAGACQYVSVEEASSLAASPVKPGVGRSSTTDSVTFEYCDYIFDPGNAPGVSVAVADLGSNSASLFSQFRESKSSESEYQAVTGVGDEAFFAGQNLYVRKGSKGLILYVGRTNSSPRGVDALPDERKLAELVLTKL